MRSRRRKAGYRRCARSDGRSRVLWLIARVATDWLRAPYGFDVYLLVAVAAPTVLYLGAHAHLTPGASA
jgi:hypothetical protein